MALLLVFVGYAESQSGAVNVFKRVSPTVVRLFNSASTGTGVVLTRQGLILTNAHVVSSPLPFQCTIEVLKDGKRQTVTFKKVNVTKIHKSMDLALVRIDPKEHNARLAQCELSKAKQPVGQRLYAIGNPATESNLVLNKSITEGLLSGVDRLIDGVKYYQISAAINPGNSGGPLCDSSGDVVGIVTLKQSDAEGVGFAIPVFDIRMSDFEDYRRKTINAKKAVELLKRTGPLMEKVRLESNVENRNDNSTGSLSLKLKRALLFQICQEAAYYDPNNPDVFTQLGLVCFLDKQFKAAQAYMIEAIRLKGEGTRPYELLSKSLSKRELEAESIAVDFEMLGRFSEKGSVWQYIGTKLVSDGLPKEGLYLILHGAIAAKVEGDSKSSLESLSRFYKYGRGVDQRIIDVLNGISPEKVEANLKRIEKLYRNSLKTNADVLVADFAKFMELETGAKLRAHSKPLRIFSLLSPDQEVLSNSRVATLSGDYQNAVEMTEALLERNDPAIRRAALLEIAKAHQRWAFSITSPSPDISKHFYKSCATHRKVKKEYGPLSKSENRDFSFALYNEACCFSLEGDQAKALIVLRESFEAGFPDPVTALEDEDLTELHATREFKRLVNEFKK